MTLPKHQGTVTLMVRDATPQSGRSNPGRNKLELRAATQDAVAEFCHLRRERLLPGIRTANPDATEEEIMALLDLAQPMYGEWDPVVELGVMAANHEYSPELRRQAMAEQAQYLRPKLKSVEMTVDPDAVEAIERRNALAERLVGLLDAAAGAKRDTIIEGVARRETPEE